MKKMEHQYFGQLNLAITDDVEVIWEKEIQGIDTCFWLGKNVELSTGILDLYAQFLHVQLFLPLGRCGERGKRTYTACNSLNFS